MTKRTVNKNKIIAVCAAAVLLAVLLFPFRTVLRDGGTAVYTPVTGIYRIYDYRGHGYSEDMEAANYGKYTVYIFGQMMYNSAGAPVMPDGTIKL